MSAQVPGGDPDGIPPLGHRWGGWPTKRRTIDEIWDEQDAARDRKRGFDRALGVVLATLRDHDGAL
jgi:hypothetical protein